MSGFIDENGRLTQHAFLCGYVEWRSTDEDLRRKEDLSTEMYREHDCFHVRQFDRRQSATKFRVFWESFPLSEFEKARELFDSQPGELVPAS